MIKSSPTNPLKDEFKKIYLTSLLEAPQFKEYFVDTAKSKANPNDGFLPLTVRIPVTVEEVAQRFPFNEAIQQLNNKFKGIEVLVILDKWENKDFTYFWLFNKFQY